MYNNVLNLIYKYKCPIICIYSYMYLCRKYFSLKNFGGSENDSDFQLLDPDFTEKNSQIILYVLTFMLCLCLLDSEAIGKDLLPELSTFSFNL